MKGFAHPDYAASLAEFGTPRKLQLCEGWILERSIPGFPYLDAMGCYPLFTCRNWSLLPIDLDKNNGDLVSLSLVADPFGKYGLDLLKQCFDMVIPFKKHYVADLSKPMNEIVSSHHRYYARKALRNISIDICEEPIKFIDEWVALYKNLVQKFQVRGLRAFSRSAFEKQLNVPGAVMFRALHQGQPVAAHLVFAQDEVCYSHLVGISPSAQDHLASYALYWAEIEYFSGKARWFDWGAAAGVKDDGKGGLAQFKRGWSTGTRPAYFCGRIFQKKIYDEIVVFSGANNTDYFPAYRNGEFK